MQEKEWHSYKIMQEPHSFLWSMNLSQGTFWESSCSCGWETFILSVDIFQSLKGYCAHQSVLCFPLLNHLATWTMSESSVARISHQPSVNWQLHEQNQIACIRGRRTDWWLYLQCRFVCLVLNHISDVRNHSPKSKQVTCFVTTNRLVNGINIKLPLRLVPIWE